MNSVVPSKLSPYVQAGIAAALMAMFAGALFLPAFRPDFRMDEAAKQTLFGLVTAVVFFFIGRSAGSAERDAAITAAAIAPANVPTTVKIDDRQPVQVQETPVDPAQMDADGRRRQTQGNP